MIELKGKYTDAKIFTNNVDDVTIGQVTELINEEFVQGSKIRIMPDCHVGKGCVIGTTMTIADKAVPNLVGADIGCGISTCILPEGVDVGLEKLDDIIRKTVPYGFNTHGQQQISVYKNLAKNKLEELKCLREIDLNRAYKCVGSLGGGNHFIELGRNEKTNRLYLFVHTGSGYLGKQIAEYYQKVAIDGLTGFSEMKNKITEDLKTQGRKKNIQKELKKIQKRKIKEHLAYLINKDLENYLHDMNIAQEFANVNRKRITQLVLVGLGINLKNCDTFDTIHNYIDMDQRILRKGSISAKTDEIVSIPINMRDGVIIGRGLGNEDWNYSAPHGAGRILSRSKAKEAITLEEFKESMVGIFSTCVKESTIDESPLAYKPMIEILENIKDTVDVLDIVKPIYNFKAN